MDVNGRDQQNSRSEEDIAFREQQMSDNLMSPFCPGRTLLACPSEEATKLRQEIRSSLKQGQSIDQIQSSLVQRYGEDIRGLGSVSSVSTLLWVAPVAFCVLAFFIVGRVLRRGVETPAEGNEENGESISD